MSPNIIEARFTVRGRGEFPLDMLRYDSCWPFGGDDAAKIKVEGEWREITLRTILVKGGKVAEAARWRSFGWEVLPDR